MQYRYLIRRLVRHGLWIGAIGTALLSGEDGALAHGVNVTYQVTQSITVAAVYDSGAPMVDAQVVVYAPENPQTPWATGAIDAQGEFTFVPDSAQPGNWEVQVRQAGHGDMVIVPLSATATTAQVSPSTSQPLTPAQIGLMGAAGVWGCVGTALFFARRSA